MSKDRLRTYALTRIKSILISKKTFTVADQSRVKSYFKSCFGIVAPENSEELEPLVLSFTAFQGNFVK
jgi:hypothetical protein